MIIANKMGTWLKYLPETVTRENKNERSTINNIRNERKCVAKTRCIPKKIFFVSSIREALEQ